MKKLVTIPLLLAALAFTGQALALASPTLVLPNGRVLHAEADDGTNGDGGSIEDVGTATENGQIGAWVDGIFWVPSPIGGCDVCGDEGSGDVIIAPGVVGIPQADDPYPTYDNSGNDGVSYETFYDDTLYWQEDPGC